MVAMMEDLLVAVDEPELVRFFAERWSPLLPDTAEPDKDGLHAVGGGVDGALLTVIAGER